MTIITTKKPFDEILHAIKDVKKIGIVSCGSCAAMCQTGGTEGAKEMVEKLEMEGFSKLMDEVEDDAAFMGGVVTGRIHDIPTVKELLERTMHDAEKIIKELPGKVVKSIPA